MRQSRTRPVEELTPRKPGHEFHELLERVSWNSWPGFFLSSLQSAAGGANTIGLSLRVFLGPLRLRGEVSRPGFSTLMLRLPLCRPGERGAADSEALPNHEEQIVNSVFPG